MRILFGFTHSGIERDLWRSRGFDAWSCDKKSCDTGNKYHIKGDFFEVMNDGWGVLIAHPVCKFLANSGVRWLHEREGRWEEMRKDAETFKRVLDAPIPIKAVENSVMHGYATEIIGRKQDQVVHPHFFGSPYAKQTCWWLDGLPKLKRTHGIQGKPIQLVHSMPPSDDRAEKRALTDPWMALAMIDQWSDYLRLMK